MMFWREPVARLEQLRRLLCSGGLIAVAHQPRGPGASDETAAANGREAKAALAQAGFGELRLESAEAYLLSAGAAVDVFGLRSNEIPDAVRQNVIQEYPRLGFKREFAGLLRAEA